jgi:hypothetical protein
MRYAWRGPMQYYVGPRATLMLAAFNLTFCAYPGSGRLSMFRLDNTIRTACIAAFASVAVSAFVPTFTRAADTSAAGRPAGTVVVNGVSIPRRSSMRQCEGPSSLIIGLTRHSCGRQ